MTKSSLCITMNDNLFPADAENTLCLSNSELDKLCNIPNDSLSEARVAGFIPTGDCLEHLFRVLKAQGKVVVDNCIDSREVGQEVCLELKIAGFIDVMSVKGKAVCVNATLLC